MSVKKGKLSTDALRDFYFSGASNYSAFKTRTDASPDVTASRITAADADRRPSATASREGSVTSGTPREETAVGSAVQAVKRAKEDRSEAPLNRTAASGDAVSPEYILFLQQQQQMVKAHNQIDDTFAGLLRVAQEQQQRHWDAHGAAADLLGVAEQSTGWNWKSKFTRDALVRDAGLDVPDSELRQENDVPHVLPLQLQHQQIVKLKQDSGDHDTFGVLLDNGIRRLDRLQGELSKSQLDATQVTRLSDDLLVQLDHLAGLAPLPKVLLESDDTIRAVEAKLKQCVATREQALEDGAMDVAETETFRLVDLGEALTNAHVDRIRLLTSVGDEHSVSRNVRDSYVQKLEGGLGRLLGEQEGLKERCEADLAKLFQLKKQVDETEQAICTKRDEDRTGSDERLRGIAEKQRDMWGQIEALVHSLQALETERHAECKRRLEDKAKDESRRNEYAVFTGLADTHAATLDRTIQNCDVHVHCAKLMHEFLQSGFHAVERHLTARQGEVDEELRAARLQHLESFRGLLFTLGELEHRKGKKIEEVSENVQAAHIQQELCNDSLNPSAKKFSDAKKELLRIRDDLELELRELRERKQIAQQQYGPTEEALNAAGIEHENPLDALEDWRLSLRSKMVEYKAIALGTAGTVAVKSELESLKRSVEQTKGQLSVNNSRLLQQ